VNTPRTQDQPEREVEREVERLPTGLNRCQAQQCEEQAQGVCPCGMLLCAACLERHAHYGRYLRAAHPTTDERGQERSGDI
jgi:hypothetical protein